MSHIIFIVVSEHIMINFCIAASYCTISSSLGSLSRKMKCKKY